MSYSGININLIVRDQVHYEKPIPRQVEELLSIY